MDPKTPSIAPGTYPGKRLLAVLTVFIFVNYLDRYVLAMLLEGIKADLALTDAQIGLLTGGAFALLYSTLALPVARLAEHRNRVMVLTGAVLVWSAATALCGLAGSFATLMAARMLVGAGESGAVSPAHSMLGDAFPLARRGMAMAVFSTGGALGTALAPVLGGILEHALGWRLTMLVLGATGIPVALLLAVLVRDPGRGLSDGAADIGVPPPIGVALRRLLARRAFVLLVPAMVAIGIAEYSLFLWLPSYFERTFEQPAVRIGAWLTAFQGLPLMVGTMAGGALVDRLIVRDRRWLAWLPMLACLVAAISIAFIFLSDRLEIALGMLVIPSLALGLYLAPSYAMIQAIAGPRSRATAVAAFTLAVNLLGLGLGPLLVGGLSDLLHAALGAQSLRYALLAVCPIYMIAACCFFAAARVLVQGIDSAASE
jgi:predicted MFS family arabinose efflux permease